MATSKITTNTPIRLQDAVCEAFIQHYAEMIEEHGASYAVNAALAQHLRNKGYSIPKLETPADRISKGQTRRWASVKEELTDAEAQKERSRELKRERDRKYKERKRAEKAAAQKEESDE
jgi:hypothetical protein